MYSPLISFAALGLIGLFGQSSDSISDVAEHVSPSVVSITTEGHAPPQMLDMLSGPHAAAGLASGVVVSSDGEIVTNNHVVENASRIAVRFSDGRELTAKVLGTDAPTDLALLKVDAKSLPVLAYGDSSKLRLGETVLAVGNPFGVGETVTMGIISAKGRSNVGLTEYEDFLQTDAAINPGNSGGALVDLRGELIGINTAILSRSGGTQGIGFAVPSDLVKPIVAQLRATGHVSRGWLGVAIQDVTPELSDALHLGAVRGAIVSDVMEGGPAAKAGIESRDVVVALNGAPVLAASQLKNAVGLLGARAKAQLTVMRAGAKKDLTVTLAEKPGAQSASKREGDASALAGVSVQPLTPELRRELSIAPRVHGGAVVDEVDPSSAAARAGLRPGDVIVGANDRTVATEQDLDALESAKSVLLRVWREGSFLFLIVQQ